MSTNIASPTKAQIANLSLLRLPEIRADAIGFLYRQFGRFGDFIHYPLGITDVYQIVHPALIERVMLTNQRNYSKDTIQFNLLATFTGQGLLTSNGRFWLRQRRLSQPAFHHSRITALTDMIVATTDRLCHKWETLADSNRPVNIDSEMMKLALEIVGQALFGGNLHEEAAAITTATATVLDYIVASAQNPLALPLTIPTPHHRHVRAAQATLDAVVHKAIADRAHHNGDHQSDSDDILSMLMAARDRHTGAPMTATEIRDEMMTFLIAGHETAAASLTWLHYLLAIHEDIYLNLLREIDGVLNNRLPTAADLPNMPYLTQVIQEALRLYPPSWLLSRRTIAADLLGDEPIPANALIIISPHTTHHHPRFWPRPFHFNPDRFAANGPASRQPRFAYIPFGGGPRRCIGDDFALTEIKLVLATILSRYRLQLKKGVRQVTAVPLVTIRPKHGLAMTIHRRQG